MPRCAVTVLARAPVPNQAKTRLAASLGAAPAADLHEALALDVAASVAAWARDRDAPAWLAVTGPAVEAAAFSREARAAAPGLCCEAQAGGDLGCRMARALSRRLREGAAASVVVGSDCPAVAGRLDEAASALLDGAAPPDAVLVPAEDGGFVLLGVRRELPEGILEGLPWGTARALAATGEALEAAGLAVRLLPPPLADVDDLPGLRALLRLSGLGAVAPRTAAWLRRAALPPA